MVFEYGSVKIFRIDFVLFFSYFPNNPSPSFAPSFGATKIVFSRLATEGHVTWFLSTKAMNFRPGFLVEFMVSPERVLPPRSLRQKTFSSD
jgi:hypothetical protein